MSTFKEKFTELKKVNIKSPESIKHCCSATELKVDKIIKSPRQQLCIQQPIYINRKKKEEKKEVKETKLKKAKSTRKVEAFVPIEIPKSPPSKDFKSNCKIFENTKQCTPNRQIQIHIEKDNKNDKQCLKKLFKKIHKLTEQLKESEKARNRLEVQLNNYHDIEGFNRGIQKKLMQVQAENYTLQGEIDLLKRQLKDKENEIKHLQNKNPQQLIKEVVVEKPVEVQIQVPKYVPGPQKIIQIPKYINNPTVVEEVERGRKRIEWLEAELEKERQRNRKMQENNSIPAIVEKPVYLQKPVYIEKPVYVDRPIEKQKIKEIPIEVPYQVPIYIDKPIVDEQMINKMADLEKDVTGLIKENDELKNESCHLKFIIGQLSQNIDILKRHNQEKNIEVESLLLNIDDYEPMKTIQIKKEIFRKNYQRSTFNPNFH